MKTTALGHLKQVTGEYTPLREAVKTLNSGFKTSEVSALRKIPKANFDVVIYCFCSRPCVCYGPLNIAFSCMKHM